MEKTRRCGPLLPQAYSGLMRAHLGGQTRFHRRWHVAWRPRLPWWVLQMVHGPSTDTSACASVDDSLFQVCQRNREPTSTATQHTQFSHSNTPRRTGAQQTSGRGAANNLHGCFVRRQMLPWGFPTTHHFVNAATKRVAAHTRTQCKSPQGTTATLHCGTRTRRML